jgi:glycerophosphoryl diester phosphodiesterase
VTHFGHRDPIARVWRWLHGTRTPPEGPPRATHVVGHRGAAREAPENTVASFARAVALGADGVEADVCRTRDGHFVVWHDNEPGDRASLARGVGGESYAYQANWPSLLDPKRRPVYDMTLAEMREVCGYSPRESFVAGLADGDTPPTVSFAMLDELLAWAAGEPRLRDLFLDIKLIPAHADRAPELLPILDAVRRGPTMRMLLPSRELWAAMSEAKPRPGLVLTCDSELPGVLADVEELGIRDVSLGYTVFRTWGDFRRELSEVVVARDRGALDSITVWTVDDEDKLRALVDARIDYVLTDEIARLRELAGG